jgi:hypothetical protein
MEQARRTRLMPATGKTIAQVLDEFLDDQEARLKQKTLAKY